MSTQLYLGLKWLRNAALVLVVNIPSLIVGLVLLHSLALAGFSITAAYSAALMLIALVLFIAYLAFLLRATLLLTRYDKSRYVIGLVGSVLLCGGYIGMLALTSLSISTSISHMYSTAHMLIPGLTALLIVKTTGAILLAISLWRLGTEVNSDTIRAGAVLIAIPMPILFYTGHILVLAGTHRVLKISPRQENTS